MASLGVGASASGAPDWVRRRPRRLSDGAAERSRPEVDCEAGGLSLSWGSGRAGVEREGARTVCVVERPTLLAADWLKRR